MTPRARLLQRLWAALDSEAVTFFQWLFYTAMIVGGLYGLIIAHGEPEAIYGAMTPGYYTTWLWLAVIGPATCLAGKLMKTHAWVYTGMWLRLTGDVTTAGVLFIYTWAFVAVQSWGVGNFATFLVVATWVSVVFLTIRDVRRLRQVEHRVRG